MSAPLREAQILNLLKDNYYTVKVKFQQGSNNPEGYTYKVPNNVELKVGDLVVVKSPFKGFTVAAVCEVHEFPEIENDQGYSYKWIANKVEVDAYEERCEKEYEITRKLYQLRKAQERKTIWKEFEKAITGTKCKAILKQLKEEINSL